MQLGSELFARHGLWKLKAPGADEAFLGRFKCKETNYRGEPNHGKPRRQHKKGTEEGWVQAKAAAPGVDVWGQNPIIEPPSLFNWIVGDPTVS